MGRAVTSAEVRVIQSILARPSATDTDRIRWAGIPSSTYNVVRRRLYESGWLAERVVPQPGPSGFTSVEFSLARPAADERATVITSWRADPAAVWVTTGLHIVVGIFFRDADPPGGRTSSGGGPTILVTKGAGTVPVFFDFAGAWANFTRAPLPSEYPRGLDLAAPPADARSRRLVSRAYSEIGESESHEGDEPGAWPGRARVPVDLVARGLLAVVPVIEPSRIGPFEGRRLGEIVVVHGPLRKRGTGGELLSRLIRDAAVAPFLFAASEREVLLGAIGQMDAGRPGRVPVPSAKRPVLPMLSEWVSPVSIAVEPVESMAIGGPHRYPPLSSG